MHRTARVLRLQARRYRHRGNKAGAEALSRVAEALADVADGHRSWAQAFELMATVGQGMVLPARPRRRRGVVQETQQKETQR
jgi:hypothetical protein